MALGLHLFGPVDLVLSGVNLGSNLGHEIWHSGTVAAAKQGYLFGLSAAAFSVPLNGEVPTLPGFAPGSSGPWRPSSGWSGPSW